MISFLGKQDSCSNFWNNHMTYGTECTFDTRLVEGEGFSRKGTVHAQLASAVEGEGLRG